MRPAIVSAILSMAALSSGSLAAFTMNIARTPGTAKLSRRNLSPRAIIAETLANNVTGGSYMAIVSVGTPGQQLSLAIDTGSSDTWVLDVNADLCTNLTLQDQAGGGCSTPFNPSKSSSFKDVLPGGFYIQYGDGSTAEGDYITDNLGIGGIIIKSQEMGLAYNVTLPTGLLGIGYDLNEASDDPSSEQNPFVYPNVIDTMVSQGFISTKAYSLYLNDLQASTGSIIFGGLDSDKYHGELLQIPIIPQTFQNGTQVYAEFAVALDAFSITSQAGNTSTLTTGDYNTPVILDSGTTLSYVPGPLATLIYEMLNAVDDTQNTGIVFVDCNILTDYPQMTFNFGFGGSNGIFIQVPANELIFDLTGLFSLGGLTPPNLPFSNACALGLNGQDEGPFVLGDTFLRSAYVVYDLTNNVIAIGQTNFNSTTSSIVDFQAGATGIPNVSGVASSVAVTETATAGLPVGQPTTGRVTATNVGGGSTSTGASSSSSSSSSSSTSTSKKSAAVASMPAFDMSGLMVLAISSAFVVLGGGWFVA